MHSDKASLLVEHTSSRESSPQRKVSFRRAAAAMDSLFRFALLMLIRCYQVGVRPWLIGTCKFCPTCSDYGAEAIQTHGAVRGSLLMVRRVLRCHPFSMGGIDPVPEVFSGSPDVRAEPEVGDRMGVDSTARIR